jgi:flagellar protein FliO/FliZ
MDPASNIWQVALALVVIVGVVVLLGFVAKRLQLGRMKTGGSLEVVASTYLGPKDRLVLVKVADQHVLVGVNSQCIANLGQFDAPIASEGSEFKSELFRAQQRTLERT